MLSQVLSTDHFITMRLKVHSERQGSPTEKKNQPEMLLLAETKGYERHFDGIFTSSNNVYMFFI